MQFEAAHLAQSEHRHDAEPTGARRVARQLQHVLTA